MGTRKLAAVGERVKHATFAESLMVARTLWMASTSSRSKSPFSRRAHLFGPASLLAIALFGLFGGSCSGGRPTTPTEITDEGLPRPTARLVIATDLLGYLEPCGCQTRPLGGIDKMAATLASVRRDGVPTAMLAAGDMLFMGARHGGLTGGDANVQEIWKAEALVGILNRLRLAAAAPGTTDLSMGLPQFATLAHAAQFPLLAAGVTIEGDPLHAGPVLQQLGNLKIGIFGVSELEQPDGSLTAGVTRALDPTMAARTSVDQLRRQGADIIVGLVRGSRRTSRRIANDVNGIDFLVTGGLNEEAVVAPNAVGHTTLLHAGRQGQRVVVVDLFRRRPGTFTDVSAWTRRAERETLTRSMTDLRQRIAGWERDSNVSPTDLAAQRGRLAEMQARYEQLARRPAAAGNSFAARVIELGPEIAGDPAVATLVDQYDARVNDHNRVAFANLAARPVGDGEPYYVGSSECATCHQAEHRWWACTPHGNAYATLQTRHKEFNLSCVGCHVTGYNQPGGSTVTHNAGLINVGCETCHGPGSAHAADPASASIARVDAPETICLQCHTQEHSDRFNYSTYRAMLIAPGHGQPEHSALNQIHPNRLAAWNVQ